MWGACRLLLLLPRGGCRLRDGCCWTRRRLSRWFASSVADAAVLHRPVLLHEVCSSLDVRPGGAYLDCTFGFGGYSRQMLALGASLVVGIDRDPAVASAASSLEEQAAGRFCFLPGRFSAAQMLVNALSPSMGTLLFDGIALDLGVSSMQLDDAARGFSFRSLLDGPLDMRMEGSGSSTLSAAAFVNGLSEDSLARVISEYGEERHARRIARAICEQRRTAPLQSTNHLARLVEKLVPWSRSGHHPATRTFQALRMLVNDETAELEAGMSVLPGLLKPGGRLAVVSFHSIEDRIVKTHFKRLQSEGEFVAIHKKVVSPTPEEIQRNNRSRSAKLRAVGKV